MITPDGRWKRPTEREKEDNRLAFVRDIAKNAKIEAYEEVLKWIKLEVGVIKKWLNDKEIIGYYDCCLTLKEHIEKRIKELNKK
jgi:hypothetical protein